MLGNSRKSVCDPSKVRRRQSLAAYRQTLTPRLVPPRTPPPPTPQISGAAYRAQTKGKSSGRSTLHPEQLLLRPGVRLRRRPQRADPALARQRGERSGPRHAEGAVWRTGSSGSGPCLSPLTLPFPVVPAARPPDDACDMAIVARGRQPRCVWQRKDAQAPCRQELLVRNPEMLGSRPRA